MNRISLTTRRRRTALRAHGSVKPRSPPPRNQPTATHCMSNAAEGFNAQLTLRWTGPFAVRQRCGEDVYVLERLGRDDIKLHISALKRVPQTTPAEAVDAAQQSHHYFSMDDVPELRLQDESSTDSRPASADPPTRGQSPALAAASAILPIRAQVDATPPPSSAQERVRFPGLRRARSTSAPPSKGEAERRAEERNHSYRQRRYDLRPRRMS